MKHWLIAFLLLATCKVYSMDLQVASFLPQNESEIIWKPNASNNFFLDSAVFEPKHQKLKAILLAVFLGHFGVHRIYLGTSPNVPVVYSLTLGGGFGLLPLLDIIAIIRSEDLNQFRNSEKVFMWQKSATQP